MKKLFFTLIFIFLIWIVSIGCAHLGKSNKSISIDDIAGSWEHIHFGYILLYIDQSGKGYLIPGLDENEDIFEINSISYSGATFVLTLVNTNNKDEQLKAECTFFGTDIIAFKPIEDNKKEDIFLFMKESKVNELRQKAKDFLKIERQGT
ncbi:MAG: hypothetical protein C4522_17940 [Desulfobacteraceae bacterium]|nr:MAG: hypothetical protein C4522_17940 [Desulfobacteraceae bacterium]